MLLLDITPEMVSLLESAVERRDDGFRFLLRGDLSQMAIQEAFLKRKGFTVGRVDAFPALETQMEFLDAVRQIWENRIAGWRHYGKELVGNGICAQDEFDQALNNSVF